MRVILYLALKCTVRKDRCKFKQRLVFWEACLLLRRFDFSRKAGEAGELESRETPFPFPSSLARPPLFAARETSGNEAAGKRCCRVVYGTILKISISCFLYLSVLHVHPGVGGGGTTLYGLYNYMQAKQRFSTDSHSKC